MKTSLHNPGCVLFLQSSRVSMTRCPGDETEPHLTPKSEPWPTRSAIRRRYSLMISVKYSCVVDRDPRFTRQVLVWASSLLTYGGGEASSLVVHTVGECHPECMDILRTWGI